MFGILSLLAFVLFHGSYAQDCIPDDVQTVTLTYNYTLYWEPSTNCDPTSYMVLIRVDPENVQHIMSTPNPYVDVSYLPACERFHFEVRAFSRDLASEAVYLNTYVPPPSGADLSITSFTASVQDGATFLNWQVTEKFAHCARGFRLVIHDTATPIPRDVYTERNNIFLNDLVPCGRYEFAVMAIYNLAEEGPISLIDYFAPHQNASIPILESVVAGETSVNISWSLPSYSVNRCTITALEVDGLPFLHQLFPVNDTSTRPLFTTSLDSLRPDNMYILRVTIVNSAGSSPANQIGVQTLPLGSS